MLTAAVLIALVTVAPGSANFADDDPLAPGAGLGLTTNRPRSVPAAPPLPVSPPAPFPIPAGALGGLAAVAGAVAARGGTAGRRSRKGSRAEGERVAGDAYDGDLRSVWGLGPGEQVLYINAAGDGQFAVRIGPEDAAHVAVLVPGTGAGLADTIDNADRARAIQRAAQRYAGEEAVTVIYALPFDAPDRILTTPWSADCACSAEKARQGGAALTEFVAALDLGHRNVTVVGHSYGSTVVGAAFGFEGLGAHARTPVFLGSPGVLVNRAADLNSTGAVYAAQASFDPIDMAGVWPVFSMLWLGGAGRDRLIHGLDPTAPAFGAEPLPTGGIGHGSYFTDARTLDGLGRIIVGKQPSTVSQGAPS